MTWFRKSAPQAAPVASQPAVDLSIPGQMVVVLNLDASRGRVEQLESLCETVTGTIGKTLPDFVKVVPKAYLGRRFGKYPSDADFVHRGQKLADMYLDDDSRLVVLTLNGDSRNYVSELEARFKESGFFNVRSHYANPPSES
ncbi:MAG: hypothetical protein AABX32_06085 [Nanoarchaeota archaeon]